MVLLFNPVEGANGESPGGSTGGGMSKQGA